MIIYADVTFINNFLMTLAVVWAVSQLLDFNIVWWRLILASLIGSLYLFVVLFLQFLNLSFYQYPLHIILNLITALLIIKIAFPYLSRPRFLKGVGYFYLVSFITIGATLAIFYVFRGTPLNYGPETTYIILSFFALFLLGKYGWRFFHQYITPDQLFLPVIIIIDGEKIELTGLIDTGNSLNDPLSGLPVIVMHIKEIFDIIPNEIQYKINEFEGDDLSLINFFQEVEWSHRIRVLPFSGIGQEHGILVGLRPDKVIIKHQQKQIKTKKVVIGLSQQIIDEENRYQVLLHPQLLKL